MAKTNTDSKEMKAWLAGKGTYQDLPATDRSDYAPVRLRIVVQDADLSYGDFHVGTAIIQTSKGIHVELSEVKDELPLVLKAIKAGEEYSFDIAGYCGDVHPPLEAYVEVDCHKITLPELERLAGLIKDFKPGKK